ncbi:hypothetical protein FRB95_009983 [Tulasnella sp. JGI-2019a]|nr:hypothetical protein FRB95_009983 [Tulasnella sp. JGI-2019a]
MSVQPGVYRIQNRKSGTYFDASVSHEGEIHGWSSRPENENQKWHVEPSGQAWKLKNARFNQYAGIRDYQDGNRVVLNGNHNEWEIQDKGYGNCAIISKGTQQCIDLDGGHQKDGTSVSVYCFRGAEQQEWQFQRVGDLPGGGNYGSNQGHGGAGYNQQQQGGGGISSGWQPDGGYSAERRQEQARTYSGAVPAGRYLVENSFSGTAADLAGGGTSEGTPITGWSCNRGANQTWELVPSQNGYHFKNAGSGTYLGFQSGGGSEGTIVHGSLNPVEWQVTQANQGYSVHLAANPNIVLDLAGGGKDDGVKICLYNNHNGANQQWKFTPV